MNNKLCINKQHTLIFFVIILIMSGLLLASKKILLVKNITYSKAKERAVIGGWNSKYDYVLRVRLNKDSQFFSCTGVLIDKAWAITAKHCFDDNNGEKVTIDSISNYYDISSPKYTDSEHMRKTNDLSIFHCAENNNCPDELSDLTLIKIATPYNKVKKFPSISDLRDDDYKSNNSVSISGWGVTKYITPTPFGEPTPVKIADKQQTTTLRLTNKNINLMDQPLNSFLIDNYDGWFWDSCLAEGDSGGPVIYNNKLIGMIIDTQTCPIGHSIALRLKDYADWISKNIIK